MILSCVRKKRSSYYQFKIQITDIKNNNKLIFGFDLKQQAEEWLYALESHLIYARDHSDNIYSHLSSSSSSIMPSYNNHFRPKLTTLLSKYINSVVLYSRLKNHNYHNNHKYNRDQYDVGYNDGSTSGTRMMIDTDMNIQVLSHNTDNHQSNNDVDDDNNLFRLRDNDVLLQNYGIINKLLYIIEYCIIMIIMMIVVCTLYYCSYYLSSLQQCCMMIIMVSSIYYLVRKIILTHIATTAASININSNISNNERNSNQCNHNCDSFVSIFNGRDTNHDDNDDVDNSLFGPYHRNHQYHVQNNNDNYYNNHNYNSNSASSFPYYNKSIDNYIHEIKITDSTLSSASTSNNTINSSTVTEKQTITPMIKGDSKGGHRSPPSVIRSSSPSPSSPSYPEAFKSIEEQQLIDPIHIHRDSKKEANYSISKTNLLERPIKDSEKDSSKDSSKDFFDISQVDKWPNYPILIKRSERMIPKRTAVIDTSTSNHGINEHYHLHNHHHHHQPHSQSQQSQQPQQLSGKQQQLIHIHKEGDLHHSIFDLESDYFVGIGFIVVAGMTSTPAHLFK